MSFDRVNENRLRCFDNPPGLVGEPVRGYDLTYMLPAKAQSKGMMLLDVTYRQPEAVSKDPYILFNSKGRILHSWPEDYTPGPFEIKRVAESLV